MKEIIQKFEQIRKQNPHLTPDYLQKFIQKELGIKFCSKNSDILRRYIRERKKWEAWQRSANTI